MECPICTVLLQFVVKGATHKYRFDTNTGYNALVQFDLFRMWRWSGQNHSTAQLAGTWTTQQRLQLMFNDLFPQTFVNLHNNTVQVVVFNVSS